MPANNLARVEPAQPMWNDEDKVLIKQTVAKGATDAEFKLLLYTAAKYDLDPLVKQIWCVKYGDKPAAIYTSRDGFLHLAHKSGQFDGMETTSLRDASGKLVGARCTVYRKGYSRPFVVEVALSEYNTGQNQWGKMPETMIKKVAESQCLRRAFDISGLYEPGEIAEERDTVVDSTARHKEPTPLHPERSARLDVADAIKSETGLDTISDTAGTWAVITKPQAENALLELVHSRDFALVARNMGLTSFSEEVKKVYPEAKGGAQYSALLHLVYAWRESGKEAANTPAASKADAVFEEAVVTPVEPEDEDF
jgi:phage recombination protein Bet